METIATIRLLALVAALLLAVPAAAIARNPNTINGMSLPMDNAFITMGANNDVAIFRTGNGSIEIDANAVCTGNFTAANLATSFLTTNLLTANTATAGTLTVTNSARISDTLTTGRLIVNGDETVTGALSAYSVSAPLGMITANFMAALNIEADPTLYSIHMRSYTGGGTIAVVPGAVVPLVFDTPLITSNNIVVNNLTATAPNGMICPPGSLFTFWKSGVYHFEASGGWVNLAGNDAQMGIYTSYETDYAWSSNDANVGGLWVKSSGDVYIPYGGVSFIYMYQSSASTNSVSPYRRRVSYRLVHAVAL